MSLATPIDLEKYKSMEITVTYYPLRRVRLYPTKVISLIDDKGNVFEPLSWEGPGPGGHREGTLTLKH